MKKASFLKFFLLNCLLMGAFAGAVCWFSINGYAEGVWGIGGMVAGSALLGAMLIGLTTYFMVKGRLRDLQLHCESISKSIGHLVDASHAVSSASTQQAASIQQTLATVTEMSASIRKNAEYARESKEVAEKSQKAAKDGEEAVAQMIISMDEINASNSTIVTEIEKGYERITEIVKVINEISQKTKIINDIVFQTKLLSFNASVEAARAGDHGKGFAVVAEEIGNLAKMSGTASREISVMLSSGINTVNTIVQETSTKVRGLVEGEKSKVDSGIHVARRCGDVLRNTVANVSKVNSMVVEISKATQEQAQGMNEISSAMEQLDTVTQQNANTAQGAADNTANISTLTEKLRRTVGALRSALLPLNEGTVQAPRVRRALPPARFTAPAAAKANVVPMKRTSRPAPPEKSEVRPAEKPKMLLEASGGTVPLGENPDFEDV